MTPIDIPSIDWIRRLEERISFLEASSNEDTTVGKESPVKYGRTIKNSAGVYATQNGTNVYRVELISMKVFLSGTTPTAGDPASLFLGAQKGLDAVQLDFKKYSVGFAPIIPRETVTGVFWPGSVLLPEFTIVEIRSGPGFALIQPIKRTVDALVTTAATAATVSPTEITCKWGEAELLKTVRTAVGSGVFKEGIDTVKLVKSGEKVKFLHKYGSDISVGDSLILELGLDGFWRAVSWDCS